MFCLDEQIQPFGINTINNHQLKLVVEPSNTASDVKRGQQSIHLLRNWTFFKMLIRRFYVIFIVRFIESLLIFHLGLLV